MNFKWKNDIHKDRYSSETEETEYEEEEEFLLPNFCKPIGILIALVPIFLKTSYVYFPLDFLKSYHYSDLALLVIIAIGVLIETWSRARVETPVISLQRRLVTALIGLMCVPFVSTIWHVLFN